MNNFKKDKISVCICTFLRPELLTQALNGIISQIINPLFSFEVVVVDNDKNRTAEVIVRRFQQNSAFEIVYDCEPEQNIALTRNRAIHNATGNLVAFIDDDEHPTDEWLACMYQCLNKYRADGVLGPVLPYFLPGAPSWLKKGGFCERKRNPTGSHITTRDMRTGNILFRRSIFKQEDMWFNPARGRTGGEDGDFLERQIKQGHRFVWCDEAKVFESVPEERWSASFYLRKEFRIGTLAGERLRRNRSIITFIKDYIILSGLLIVLPLSLLTPKHIWMKLLIKMSYHTGRLLSYCGFSFPRYRK